jgi:hypothetical protein
MPKVAWVPASRVAADLDCDGSADFAFLGTTPSMVYVGVVHGTPAKVGLLAFHRSGDSQDSLCPGAVTLRSESLDYTPDVGAIPGFTPSKTCRGLVLHGGECDDFHLFWNRQAARLDWWRN